MMHALQKFLFFYTLTCFGGDAVRSGIINGKKSTGKSMMYMASVQNKRGHHICGGFLVSEDFVITAAHCDQQNPVSVVLGTYNLKKVDDKTMRYSVKKCKHPYYKDLLSGRDIMLLKLSRIARVGKKVIKPIQLPKHDMKLKENKKCLVAGWGSTRTEGEISDRLHEVDVSIINLEKCQKEWHNRLPPNVTCAGGYNTKKGFCQGDSGGPLVCNGKAVGVVSFNNHQKCDYPDLPNIYTDISKFLPWVNESLQKKNC